MGRRGAAWGLDRPRGQARSPQTTALSRGAGWGGEWELGGCSGGSAPCRAGTLLLHGPRILWSVGQGSRCSVGQGSPAAQGPGVPAGPPGHAELLPRSPGHRSPLNDFQRLRATELLAVPADPPPPLPERGSAEQCAQRCAASLVCR